MFINYEMATIEITKAEAKEAGVFKSEMYENLKEAREAIEELRNPFKILLSTAFTHHKLIILIVLCVNLWKKKP